MVMVHVAATAPPPSIGSTSALGYVVAGLGGLAAPLFVVLAGWGAAETPAVAFPVCASRPAPCSPSVGEPLCAPLVWPVHAWRAFLVRALGAHTVDAPSQAVQRGVRATAAMLPAVVLLAPTLQGPSAWDERVLVREFRTWCRI